jgi:uncharacterized small protein (DUF1192 family)
MSPTLVGVLIGTATTLAVLAVQLWFNARQRERDRHMQLKRDVFLEAAEGLAGTVSYVMEHTRTDLPLGSVKPPTDRPGWLFKIHLVASTETLIAFNTAAAAAAAAAMDVFTHRIGVAELADDIAVVRTTIERIQAFQEELKAETRAMNIDVATERTLKRIEWLQQQLDDSWAQMKVQTTELERLTGDHAERTRALVRRGFIVSADVNRAVRTALLAARAELEVPIDIAKFEVSASGIDRNMTQTIDTVLERLR